MQLTPAYLTSVATFYDMFTTVPKPRNDVYVCTNISCSLLGADEFFEAMLAAAEGHPDVNVALVRVPGRVRHRADGVGQRRVRRAARARRRRPDRRGPATPAGPCSSTSSCATAGAPIPSVGAEEASDFGPRPTMTEMADTAGLGPEGDTVDRPGPTAPIEMTDADRSEHPEPDKTTDEDEHPAGQEDANEDPVRPHRRAGPEHAARCMSGAAATSRCARR